MAIQQNEMNMIEIISYQKLFITFFLNIYILFAMVFDLIYFFLKKIIVNSDIVIQKWYL